MESKGSVLYRSFPIYQVSGANPKVGKTVCCAILCNAIQRHGKEKTIWYMKAASTVSQAEADNGHVTRFADGASVQYLPWTKNSPDSHSNAAVSSETLPSDETLLSLICRQLTSCARSGHGFMLLEISGGVHSPSPSGTSQADLYRTLRLPVILVADYRLGGASSTISAFESLYIRGYDVIMTVVFQHDQNKSDDDYLGQYFKMRNVAVFSLPQPPHQHDVSHEDELAMDKYYKSTDKLSVVDEMASLLLTKHEDRLKNIYSMASRAYAHIWYPFTQHQDISASGIAVIDSAYGDFFQTYTFNPSDAADNVARPVDSGDTESSDHSRILQPTFDGSASWWTQGLGHGNSELLLAAAHAAGRYGHVMFPGNIHEPALSLAEIMLRNLKNPRLQKVFYSDNGCTGMEIAVKMGLKAASLRYGLGATGTEVGVIGLKGSYHGDTIGSMDCSEPSAFNQKVEWYSGRGYWFDYPTVYMTKGTWVVDVPTEMEDEAGPSQKFSSLNELFNLEGREKAGLGDRYKTYIKRTLERLVKDNGKRFGALVMEPVILGAGGMIFADPLFQRCLVQVVRENPSLFSASSSDQGGSGKASPSSTSWTGLPVIFDEVFTGLYRLGRFSSASFLGIQPDISVHAKLLAGGLVPLCATLASQSVFEAFLSSEKSDALLHGHSYTAHTVGCKVAETSLLKMLDMEKDGYWDKYKHDWLEPSLRPLSLKSGDASGYTKTQAEPEIPVWSTWSKSFVHDLSHGDQVDGVLALGSLLAIYLRDHEGAGYTSNAAKTLQLRLLEGERDWNIHSRVLGNVLYLMAGQSSKPETLLKVQGLVRAALL